MRLEVDELLDIWSVSANVGSNSLVNVIEEGLLCLAKPVIGSEWALEIFGRLGYLV